VAKEERGDEVVFGGRVYYKQHPKKRRGRVSLLSVVARRRRQNNPTRESCAGRFLGVLLVRGRVP